jgi:hypothetical protein
MLFPPSGVENPRIVGFLPMRGRKLGVALGIGAAATALALATGVATGAEPEGATIASGRLRGIEWAVEAAPDEGRKGICFGVGYGKRLTPYSFDVQCSGPAEKRGIFTALESSNRHGGFGAITVVGMALNVAVARVEVTSLSGRVEVLRPKKARGPGSDLGHVAEYRYIAFAVRGPWCAKKVATYDRTGAVLFEDDRPELPSRHARLVRRCSR